MLNEVAEGKRGMEQDGHLSIMLREISRIEDELTDIEYALDDIEKGLLPGMRESSNRGHWLRI